VGDIYSRFPENWAIAQDVMFADSTTFMAYNANMRNLVMDKLVGGQMVVFNRLTPGQDTLPFHKIVRAANRRIDILYDYTDGTTEFDELEDPLPFDINAPVIVVNDEDYALWYRDVTEEPQKYDGKTVSFKAQVAMLRRDKKSMFAPGRFVMTCCEDDIQFCGVPCRYDKPQTLQPRSWVAVTATIKAENHQLYQGELGPVLTAIKVEPAEPAEQDVATF
ncbi:MAG: GTPase, partial [Oscillospiraceae bacterium]|nr:GTPase [Oscillospiraceae bacterium]